MLWLINLTRSTVISLSLSLIFSLTALGIYIYSRRKLNYWQQRGFPQLPNAHWLFGHIKDAILFRTAPGWHIGNLYRAANRNSPYVGFYIFHKPCLLLRDPQIIKQLLVRDFDNFSDRHFGGRAQKDSTGMYNLLGMKNPVWKYVRSRMTPALTRDKLKKMFPLMKDTGSPMIECIERQLMIDDEKKKIIDVQELCYKYTTDIIANIGLGIKVNSFRCPNEEFTRAMMNYFHGLKRMIAQVIVFFIPELIHTIGNSVLLSSQFLRSIFWETIKSREKTKCTRGDFIDSLLRLKNGEQSSIFQFDGNNLFDQIGLCLSGFETSATATSFTFLELAKNKDCQDKVRSEILQSINNEGWTFEALNCMKYLDQCIAETIRIHPPVATLDRYTRNDYKLPGTDLVIEGGTPIFISLYGLHDDDRFFDEPKNFKPERFDLTAKKNDAYLAFGNGPRMCIGLKAGLQYVKTVIAMILKDYEITNRPDDKNELDTRSTLTAAANGINLRFEKLSNKFTQL